MREVVHIFEREGPHGGPYWRLVLECGHSVARPGPFAARLAVGTEVVVRSTCGTRSLFELDGFGGAIWPEHASQWKAVNPADPVVLRVTSHASE